jgi:hypothetical protein
MPRRQLTNLHGDPRVYQSTTSLRPKGTMRDIIISSIVHGTQAGSEGIIGVLIGLLH